MLARHVTPSHFVWACSWTKDAPKPRNLRVSMGFPTHVAVDGHWKHGTFALMVFPSRLYHAVPQVKLLVLFRSSMDHIWMLGGHQHGYFCDESSVGVAVPSDPSVKSARQKSLRWLSQALSATRWSCGAVVGSFRIEPYFLTGGEYKFLPPVDEKALFTTCSSAYYWRLSADYSVVLPQNICCFWCLSWWLIIDAVD